MPHLWMFLEKKYLPSYVPVDEDGKPLNLEWVKEANSRGEYVSRWVASEYDEIRKLEYDSRLTYEEMMVFRSTFDFAKVLGEDIPVYLECLKAVADECGGNYPLQYQALSGYVKTHSIRNIEAIAFNQTSVNCASGFFGEKYDAPISKFWDCMFFKDIYSKIRNQKMSKLNENF